MFVGLTFKKIANVDEFPIWVELTGILIGCLLGILIPKIILKYSTTLGLNKIKASAILFGNTDLIELKELIDHKKSLLDYRAKTLFKRLDTSKFNYLDTDDIRAHFIEAMGPYYNETEFTETLEEFC